METQISLEVFPRHFLVTHLKGNARCVLDQLKQRAERSGEKFSSLLAELVVSCYPQPGYQDNSWYAREVPLVRCYSAHTDFRLHPIPRDQPFVDFMCTLRPEIELGSFPCSSEIRAPWEGPMPEPLVQEREHDKFFVLDGQLRLIRHWYHNVPKLRVFIYKGQCSV